MQRDEIELGPYFRYAFKRKWAVLAWALLGAAVALTLTILVKPMWKCDAVLLLPMQGSSDPLLAILKTDADPLEMLKGVVESKSNLDYLNQRTNLPEHDLEKMLNVQTKKDQNQVIISATDWNKNLALQVVGDSIVMLRRETGQGNLSIALLQASQLKADLDLKMADLKKAEDKLLHFVQKAKTAVDPTNPFNAQYIGQKKAVEYQLKQVQKEIDIALDSARKMSGKALVLPTAIPNQGQLRAQLVQQEYELNTKLTQLGPGNADVKALQDQIEVTKKLILDEVQKYMTSAEQGFDPTLAQLFGQHLLLEWQNEYFDVLAKAAPLEQLEALRLYREVGLESDAMKFAREKYEAVKLQGVTDPTQWSVLDPPYIEEKPSNKRFGLFSVLGAFVGLIIGFISAVSKENKANGGRGPNNDPEGATAH